MTRIVLTPEQERTLELATGPVQIVDLAGRVMATLEFGFTQAEVADAKKRAETFQSAGTFRKVLDQLKADTSAETVPRPVVSVR